MISRTLRAFDRPALEIAREAQQRLEIAQYASIRRLSCECDDAGVLFLRGSLPTFYHKQLAQQAVAGLEGVTQVVNETVVSA